MPSSEAEDQLEQGHHHLSPPEVVPPGGVLEPWQ